MGEKCPANLFWGGCNFQDHTINNMSVDFYRYGSYGKKYPTKISKTYTQKCEHDKFEAHFIFLILLRLAILNDTVAFSSENLNDFPKCFNDQVFFTETIAFYTSLFQDTKTEQKAKQQKVPTSGMNGPDDEFPTGDRITESEAKNKVDAAQKWALGKPHFPTFIERYMRYIWYNWISSDFKAKLFLSKVFFVEFNGKCGVLKNNGIISREVHKLAGICRNITLKRWLQMQSERSAGPGYSWSTWVSKGWMLMDVL